VSWCLGGKNSVLKQPRPKVSQNIILINTTKTQRHKAFPPLLVFSKSLPEVQLNITIDLNQTF
ncbi:MAG TPA: hypothetical protein PLD63_14550, partial [Ignavibacteria bacterium]|nr:hypothetical protein [Ignavibacteria bacterium]